MQLRHLLVSVSTVGAFCMTGTPAYATPTAAEFVHTASIANEFEIETSKAALEKSQNKDVKTLAQHMIDDHTTTAQGLQVTLTKAHSAITPETALDKDHQAMLDTLNAASAEDFDSTYAGMQKDAHKQAITLFTDYSRHGDNPSLKAFAASTLPALQKHLKHVTQLNLTK